MWCMSIRSQNKREKQFLEDMVEWAQANGPVAEGEGYLMIHHTAGRSCVHNKILIGYYFILPLPSSLHETGGNHPLNITYHRKAFTKEFGNERDLFKKRVDELDKAGKATPPPEVMESIMTTRY